MSRIPINTKCVRCGEELDEHPHAQMGDPRGWHCKDRPCRDCEAELARRDSKPAPKNPNENHD